MSGRHIPIGKIIGLFGIAGWVKVHSYTRPRHNIVAYTSWRLAPHRGSLSSPAFESARRHGNGVAAKFAAVDDRTAAVALLGREVTVDRAQFSNLPPGEYYWFQLVGLTVVGAEGRVLGVVRRLLETGANDVLVVAGEDGDYLIPYVDGAYVKAVNLEKMRVEVDWKAEWRI